MEKSKKISIQPVSDLFAAFNGIYAIEPCRCCGKPKKSAHLFEINDETILCDECLTELYEEAGYALHKSVKLNDTVWELTCCNDGEWRIFPMTVKNICPHGAVIWVTTEDKAREPRVWNIYAESDYTSMYKSFYDEGVTLFFTEESANAALAEHIQKEEENQKNSDRR